MEDFYMYFWLWIRIQYVLHIITFLMESKSLGKLGLHLSSQTSTYDFPNYNESFHLHFHFGLVIVSYYTLWYSKASVLLASFLCYANFLKIVFYATVFFTIKALQEKSWLLLTLYNWDLIGSLLKSVISQKIPCV